jgi:hypothetical protein
VKVAELGPFSTKRMMRLTFFRNSAKLYFGKDRSSYQSISADGANVGRLAAPQSENADGGALEVKLGSAATTSG